MKPAPSPRWSTCSTSSLPQLSEWLHHPLPSQTKTQGGEASLIPFLYLHLPCISTSCRYAPLYQVYVLSSWYGSDTVKAFPASPLESLPHHYSPSQLCLLPALSTTGYFGVFLCWPLAAPHVCLFTFPFLAPRTVPGTAEIHTGYMMMSQAQS